MSDLIEKIKKKVNDVEAARGPAKHILNDRLADLGQVAWDHWEEIVQALETVRGIEEILSSGSGEVFIDGLSLPGKIVISTSSDRDVVIEPTLSAAVEAANQQ